MMRLAIFLLAATAAWGQTPQLSFPFGCPQPTGDTRPRIVIYSPAPTCVALGASLRVVNGVLESAVVVPVQRPDPTRVFDVVALAIPDTQITFDYVMKYQPDPNNGLVYTLLGQTGILALSAVQQPASKTLTLTLPVPRPAGARLFITYYTRETVAP